MNDPLDDLLRPVADPASPELREEVWRRTAALLRRRRPRPIAALALLAAGIAAGLLLCLAPPAPRTTQPPAPTERLGLYQQADRYLDEGRPDEAVRCYGQALDAAPREELELSSEDHFLLMAIKHARKKELDACEH